MRKANEMKETQSRGSNGRFLPTTSPEEAKIAELEAQVVQLQTSNKWSEAEFARINEEKRLADQGRDAAIESRDRFRADLVAANNRERALEREGGALREELQHVALKLDNRKEDLQAARTEIDLLKESVTTAEKRGELTATHAIFEGNLKTIVVGVILSVIFYMIGKWGKL